MCGRGPQGSVQHRCLSRQSSGFGSRSRRFERNQSVSSPSTCESQYCGEPPWPRGSVLGLRPPGLEFRVLCLEDSGISIISPSSGGSPGPVQPICAQRWPKARFISFHFVIYVTEACSYILLQRRGGGVGVEKGCLGFISRGIGMCLCGDNHCYVYTSTEGRKLSSPRHFKMRNGLCRLLFSTKQMLPWHTQFLQQIIDEFPNGNLIIYVH